MSLKYVYRERIECVRALLVGMVPSRVNHLLLGRDEEVHVVVLVTPFVDPDGRVLGKGVIVVLQIHFVLKNEIRLGKSLRWRAHQTLNLLGGCARPTQMFLQCDHRLVTFALIIVDGCIAFLTVPVATLGFEPKVGFRC